MTSADPIAPRVDAALSRVRRATDVSLAFGGRVHEAGVTLRHFDGGVVGPLRGVRLDLGHGLGGRVVAQQRSLAFHDYVRTPLITHKYDAIIRAEGLRAMAAVPVIVGRRPVAVLYAALRTAQSQMDRVLDAVTHEARALEQELVSEDAEQTWRSKARDAHAELRLLAARLDDEELRSAVLRAADLLTEQAPDDAVPVHLTGREQDVLALLAGGLSNRAIAERLDIGVYTVKDHVKSLLAKLGASSRFEVVVHARRAGLLP
ncbi:LuxR C-terminal-related transcriptional regulator [uncultured Aeromicrobium sp.]|uniref:LuxR C-terminal-related transcriptional regulator n=1 Tax=uncultured Aeromicrobium sp. TaxID=337820 RepID=UPI0025D3BE91|nr:LuxR C-terminal-related transcriptional regulator [uncultured Aeromicrobium sp.]